MGFTTQRLLSNQRVRTNRAGVDFVLHEVTEFQHVDDADHDVLMKLISGAPVVERGFPVLTNPVKAFDFLGFFHVLDHGIFGNPIKHRRGHFKA